MTEFTSHNPYHLLNSTNDRSSLFPVAQEIVVLLIFRNAIQLYLCVSVCACGRFPHTEKGSENRYEELG